MVYLKHLTTHKKPTHPGHQTQTPLLSPTWDSKLIVLDDAAMSLIGQFTSHLFRLYFPLSSLLYNKVSRILWRLWWNEVRRKTRNNDTELEYPSPYAISYPCFFKNVFRIPVSSKMNFMSCPFSSRRMTNIAPCLNVVEI